MILCFTIQFWIVSISATTLSARSSISNSTSMHMFSSSASGTEDTWKLDCPLAQSRRAAAGFVADLGSQHLWTRVLISAGLEVLGPKNITLWVCLPKYFGLGFLLLLSLEQGGGISKECCACENCNSSKILLLLSVMFSTLANKKLFEFLIGSTCQHNILIAQLVQRICLINYKLLQLLYNIICIAFFNAFSLCLSPQAINSLKCTGY